MGRNQKPIGRPPKYKPEMIEDLLQRAKKGHTITEICSEWNITRQTFYRWRDEHPAFSDALKLSRIHYEAWYSKFVRGVAGGQVPGANVTALIWLGRNTCGWSDLRPHEEDESVDFELHE